MQENKAEIKTELQNMAEEMKAHLQEKIIPFWKNLKDTENGGYYGFQDFDLKLHKGGEKGCILNSRILWFFSAAAMQLGDNALLADAEWAYRFLRDKYLDKEYGGLYWSVTAKGEPLDTTKHTYSQAFGIYALAAYYEATGDKEALKLALTLYHLIEESCRDEGGYLEAFSRSFERVSNEKLSGNGVLAERTMNTLLHVLEAYTGLYRVRQEEQLGNHIRELLDLFAEKVYNSEKMRQEVFFDSQYISLVDLQSYGHDIEASWLLDEGAETLSDKDYEKKIFPLSASLAEQVYRLGFDGASLANECEQGKTDQRRIWWVQAEAVTGFLNAAGKATGEEKYLLAALKEWEFIKKYLIDKRPGSEWFWEVTREGIPCKKPIVEPWKCPYHNGRMCMEVIKRIGLQKR